MGRIQFRPSLPPLLPLPLLPVRVTVAHRVRNDYSSGFITVIPPWILGDTHSWWVVRGIVDRWAPNRKVKGVGN